MISIATMDAQDAGGAVVEREVLLLEILAYAVPIGTQDFGDGIPPLELFRLIQPIPGHPLHSTVVRDTLERAIRKAHPVPHKAKYGSTTTDGVVGGFEAVESNGKGVA